MSKSNGKPGKAATPAARAATRSAQQAARSRQQFAERAEVGPLPKPFKPRRRNAARKSLIKFLTIYFPHSTGLKPFSADHKRMIGDMQQIIEGGGRLVNAVYRGFAKTTICENAAIWATVNGYRQFVLVLGINAGASTANIDSIKAELAENDLLAEDYPEVCLPIRALENKPQRAPHQTCNGQHTHLVWRADMLVLPTIKGSKASGAIIVAKPYAKARGVKYKRRDGAQARPDLVIIDDPQDDESATSPIQVNKNLTVLRKGILQTAGHQKGLAAIVNATIIAKGDMIETLLGDPAWEGQRVPMVRQWADEHEELWLKQYADLRREFDRSVPGDQKRAKWDATRFYRRNRRKMDRGCAVSWRHCFDRTVDPPELSAIQHAYNKLIDDGKGAFSTEYQQEPFDEAGGASRLTAPAIAAKCNGLERGLVPQNCRAVVAGIDVHDRLLYWLVLALADGFAGAVIDYGTWPRQPSTFFSMNNCPRPLEIAYPGCVQDAYILAGLQECTKAILERVYPREDGAPLRVEKLLIDAHWGEKTELVKAFCRRHPDYNRVVLPSFGAYVKPGDILRVGRKPGGRYGPGWGMPPAERGMVHVTFDADFCKSEIAQRLAVPLGTPGGFELFGREPRVHGLLAEHFTAQRGVEITRGEARKESWEALLNRDDHWWDNLVQCLVCGLLLGIDLPGVETQRKPRPADQRPTLAQLAKR